MKATSDILIAESLDLPVTVAEMHMQSRVDFSDDDALLQAYIRAASDHISAIAGRALCLEERESHFSVADSHMWLGRPHVRRVTRVYWIDPDGDETDADDADWALFDVDYPWAAGYVRFISGALPGGIVRVRYECGWSDGDSLPESLRQAVRLLAAHFYANREGTVPGVSIAPLPLGIAALVEPYRWRGMP